jgi:hypothetical protein
MIETKTHKVPIQGTVKSKYVDPDTKEILRISGEDNDPISPIDFFELPGFPSDIHYSCETISIDLVKEEAEVTVTAETSFHTWLEGKLTDKADYTNLKKQAKFKLKRNDLKAIE